MSEWLNFFVSSAKRLMLLLTSASKAILLKKNNSRPITSPLGTSLKIDKDSKNVLPTNTF